jgi:hypothetical protein
MARPARGALLWGALSLAALCVPVPAQAQTATIYGALSNFDVVNNTGDRVYGFEVEIEGVEMEHVLATFKLQRYGAPAVVPYVSATWPHPPGVRIQWTSQYDFVTQQFLQATAAHAPDTAFAGSCYQWHPATYDAAGCEHFGVGLSVNPSKITSRWMVADPATLGGLAPQDPPMAVAAPSYSVLPGAQAGLPPALVVNVRAPLPARAFTEFGDAQWMKVFVTQLPREVTLDELLADNALVPQDAAQLEADWDILQTEPAGSGGTRGLKQNQGNLDPATRSVVRRIELYKFTGAYDPVTHEATCADVLCKAPAAGEVGDFISAQMTAANVQSDSVTVTSVGNGKVESLDRRVSCPGPCGSPYVQGTMVTLTARPGSDSTFGGWTGACTGTGTCTVTATGHVDVGATFTLIKVATGGGTLSLSTSGKTVIAPVVAPAPPPVVVAPTPTPVVSPTPAPTPVVSTSGGGRSGSGKGR